MADVYGTGPLLWGLLPGWSGYVILSFPADGHLLFLAAVPLSPGGNLEITSFQTILNDDWSVGYVVNFTNVGPVPTDVEVLYTIF
jgi:hypothetical protein